MAHELIKFVDHITFPKVMGEIIRNNPDFEGVQYTSSFPKEDEDRTGRVPCIVYRLLRRVPGIEGLETKKPRFRSKVHEDDGTITEVWSQWMTNSFQFDCVALSNDEADELVWKLDQLLQDNVVTFLQLGARDLIFDEQLEDALLPRSKDLCVRSLRWTLYTDAVRLRNVQGIDEIRIRTFLPQDDAVEAVVRAASLDQYDVLQQTHITKIIYVSNPSPSGIARTEDYLPGVDFVTVYDPHSARTAILWTEEGRHPQPGQTYYVRYAYWTAFSTLYLPSISDPEIVL